MPWSIAMVTCCGSSCSARARDNWRQWRARRQSARGSRTTSIHSLQASCPGVGPDSSIEQLADQPLDHDHGLIDRRRHRRAQPHGAGFLIAQGFGLAGDEQDALARRPAPRRAAAPWPGRDRAARETGSWVQGQAAAARSRVVRARRCSPFPGTAPRWAASISMAAS